MKKLLEILGAVIVVVSVLFPFVAYAEAEQIYVSGMDIDYMEPNPMSGWIEDMKDQIADTSPFIGQFLFPEESSVSSSAEEEEFIVEDDVSSFHL